MDSWNNADNALCHTSQVYNAFFLFVYACANLPAGSPKTLGVSFTVRAAIASFTHVASGLAHWACFLCLAAVIFPQNVQINYLVYSPKPHMITLILETLAQIPSGMGRRIGICQEPQERGRQKNSFSNVVKHAFSTKHWQSLHGAFYTVYKTHKMPRYL